MVTWNSSIACSSADWVFGPERLISSTSTMLANSGPGTNSNFLSSRLKMWMPVMSEGIRSAVHCTRLKLPPSAAATDFASRVLPIPGTPCSSTWPPAISPMHNPCITLSKPNTTFSSCVRSCCSRLEAGLFIASVS